MDINVYNTKLLGMNPTDLGMVWMGHIAPGPERSLIMDENATFYSQPTVGLSVMDDLAQQTHAMVNFGDMNPMLGMVPEYLTTPSAGTQTTITATTGLQTDLYNLHAISQQQQQQQQQQHQHSQATDLDAYQIEDDELDEENSLQHDQQSQDHFLHHQQQQHIYQMHYKTSDDPDSHDISDYDSNEYIMQSEDDPNQLTDFIATNNLSEKHTIATQTQGQINKDGFRKIKPVKRPGLVLQSPIAYAGNVDPSEIPIQKDGMAVCETCGAIGVKHSFYTKERRYCSMACSRNFYRDNQLINHQKKHHNKLNNDGSDDIELELKATAVHNPNYKFVLPNYINDNNDKEISIIGTTTTTTETATISTKTTITTTTSTSSSSSTTSSSSIMYRDILPQEEIPQIISSSELLPTCPQEDRIITVRRRPGEFINSYDWTQQLSHPDFVAAPVTCFKHAPGYELWSKIVLGIKVEVENTDCDSHGVTTGIVPHSFWVASVLKIHGYKALLRYDGFDNNRSHDFWVNLCSSEVHHVGWCATRGKPLIPPRSIVNKYSDWKEFLMERLYNARTLPSTFYNKLSDSFKSRFNCGLQLEVVDKNRISQVKVATIQKIVGKRLYVRYFDGQEDNGFWCHEDSSLIHPVGWATTVGHKISAPQHYMDRMIAGKDSMIDLQEDDATMDLFKMNFTFEEYYLDGKVTGFLEGMKLEAIDPLNLSSICVATVMAVLKFGYMMIRIDVYDPDVNGSDWFCYHEKSPCIFPVGFCAKNNIQLVPPKGYTADNFDWEEYLQDTGSVAASEEIFDRDMPSHQFRIGMKVECADLMDPRLVCVATISRVVGRLLKVHFDGWEEEYDQWLDSESPDMFPVGWCVMVNHRLEGPKMAQPVKIQSKTQQKGKRGRGKKVKLDNSANIKTSSPIPPISMSTSSTTTFNTTIPSRCNPSITIKKETDTISIKRESSPNCRSGSGTEKKFTPLIKQEPKHQPYDDDDFDAETDTSEQTNITSDVPESDTSSMDRISVSKQTSTLSMQQQTSPQSNPPAERKATSYINNSIVSSTKYIPRLIDSNNSPESNANSGELCPDGWNIFDVAQFLRVNDCTAHCDTFSRNKVDGKKLLDLTKDEIITILGMKVGPSLKIYDLIQQLKCKTDPIQSRRLMKANLNKKFL